MTKCIFYEFSRVYWNFAAQTRRFQCFRGGRTFSSARFRV